MTDEEIDTTDIPPLGPSFFARAKSRAPLRKAILTMTVDADVLDWFRAQGDDFETRLNAALRIYADAHREQRY
ncbi:MAG: BrnA antitoxin family protein [Blastocatellia bacterium]